MADQVDDFLSNTASTAPTDPVDDFLAQQASTPAQPTGGHAITFDAQGHQISSVPLTDGAVGSGPAPVQITVGGTNPSSAASQIAAGSADAMNLPRGVLNSLIATKDRAGILGGKMANALHLTSANDLGAYENYYGGQANALDAQNAQSTNGRIGGFIGGAAASAPLVMAAGAPVAAAADALGVNALATPFVGAVTRLATSAARGAAEGGAANALLSANNGQSVRQNALQGLVPGAVLGVGVPAIAGAGKYLSNMVRAGGNMFTDSGTSRIALNALHSFTGGAVPVDTTQIVPGSVPTMAEAVPGGNAAVSQAQTAIKNTNPALNEAFAQREVQQNDARHAAFTAAAGTPQDIETAEIGRADQAQKSLDQVFATPKSAPLGGINQTIETILAGPSGQRPAVAASLGKVKSIIGGMTASNNTADAETLYNSARKGIGDMLDKADVNSAAGRQASSELLQVRDAMDDAIEAGAPGFKQYLSGYSGASRPIEAMQKLQGLNLTDARGNITLAKVQNAVTNLQRQQAASGVSAAKSVSAAQLATLQSIRDDLLRAGQTTFGAPKGSPTFQNMASGQLLAAALPGKAGVLVGKTVAPEAAGGAVGGLLGYVAGHMVGYPTGGEVAGNVAGVGAGRIVRQALNAKNSAVTNRLGQFMLNPDSYQVAAQKFGRPAAPNALLALVKPSILPGAVIGNALLTAPTRQKSR